MIRVYWLYTNENDNILTDGYVGVTKNEKVRFAKHRINFGEFKFKIIFYGNIAQALALELYLRPKPGIGWNKSIGGFEGYKLGHCEETIKIIKEKRKLQSAPRLGMKHKTETIERIRKSNLGLKRSEETKAKLKIAKTDISNETRERIRKASTGRALSIEGRAKVSEALIKRIRKPETSIKIGIAAKKRWDDYHNFYFDPNKVIILKSIAKEDAEAEYVNKETYK